MNRAEVKSINPNLPKWRYHEVAPDTPAGRYLRTFWHPVAVASHIRPGEAKPLHVLGESFTIYRTPDGKVHITEFRCAHRRTQLSTGWVENDGIRCMYHGWKFGTDGQCLEIPGEDDARYASRIKLESYPVEEYLGLIFAYFGKGDAPKMPRYTAFENADHLDQIAYTRECNHFQNIENGIDEVHVNFTHSVGTFEHSGLNDEIPRVEAEETSYGILAKGIRSGDRVREMHYVVPNILMLKLPAEVEGETDWRNYVSWRVPINEDVHYTFIVMGLSISAEGKARYLEKQKKDRELLSTLEPFKDVARKVLAGEISMADVGRRPDITSIQDYVTQIGQDVIVDRSAERLARSDLAIVKLRRLWDRELAALEEGKALTQWQVPEMLAPSKGL